MIHCPICRSQTERFEDTKLRCTTRRCMQCALIFKDRACRPDEATELKKYRQHNNSLENEGYVQMFEAFIGWVLSHHERLPKSILDYGSGPEPVLAELLRQRGFSVQIYDKHFAPEAPAEGTAFDLITCTEVIEHVADPLTFMHTLHSYLQPGGYAAMMTLLHTGDIDTYLSWWYRRDPTHLCFFTLKTFRTLAERSGFFIEACDEKRYVLLRRTS